MATIMKKIYSIGLAILSILCVDSAMAVTVYNNEETNTSLAIFGEIDVGAYKKHEITDDDKAKIIGRTRIGILGSSEISTNVKALAFAEWEVASSTSQNKKFNARYAYTGFDFTQYGVLVFGQGDTATYQTVGFTDVFENLGSKANAYWTLGGRQEGQLMYVNAVSDYTIALSAQTAFTNAGSAYNHDLGTLEQIDVNWGYAAALSYNWSSGALEDLAFSLGYDYYSLKNENLGGRHYFDVALSYGHLDDGIYIAGLYNKVKYAGESHHITGWELVGGYTFESGFGFMLGAGYSGYQFDKTCSSYAVGQLTYNFTDTFKIYTEGEFGLGRLDYPEKETHQNSKYSLNLQYKF